jgi:hypothetical protein
VKVVCGLVAGTGISNGVVPDLWKSILVNGDWPEGWGLYLPIPATARIFSREISIETDVNPVTNEILNCRYGMAGVSFNLLLGKPDAPSAFGFFRPKEIIFKLPDSKKHIELKWFGQKNKHTVMYSTIGTTEEDPPHLKGLKN